MRCFSQRCTSAAFFAFLFLLSTAAFSQGEEDKLQWASSKPVVIPASYEKFSQADLVILDDKTDFSVYPRRYTSNYYHFKEQPGTISRNILVKINTEKGLEKLKNVRLPESFDRGYDENLYKQGRQARITVPYTYDYRVKHFMARKFSKSRWSEVPFKDTYTQVRRISRSGEFISEDVVTYQLQNLVIGDIVEVYYESFFSDIYDDNLFYFSGAWPKLNCEYTFKYPVPFIFAKSAFLFPVMIADSAIKRSVAENKDYIVHTDKITLQNLNAVNYPANSFEGRAQPHVSFDFTSHTMAQHVSADHTKPVDVISFKPKNFEWVIFTDTTNYFTKIYDKRFASIRKFITTMPPLGSDSANFVFFKALCDTFNNFRFLTMNQLFYNEQHLYPVSSADHLLKRRMAGETWPIYRDILDESKIFYYLVNIQDKRYSEHSQQFRVNHAYERNIVAIPNKDSYIYFMPRYNGMKYHLNELPFYYEGALGVMQPENFQKETADKSSEFFKFIRTHKGTYNENTRTENATVRISTDSLKADLVTKESLSGQFSTVLRHLYLNEFIDSTIAPYYFKKCTAKPGASAEKIKLSSRITDYPFRYTFNCSEKIKLAAGSLDLSNWFSFILSKATLPEAPTHDYYFDFTFSDSYNFLLNFDRPVDLTNAAAFSKKISTDMFELESEIVKNSESAYLLKVRLAVKQNMLHWQEAGSLMDLVATLDELNSFSLNVVRK